MDPVLNGPGGIVYCEAHIYIPSVRLTHIYIPRPGVRLTHT